MTKLSCSSWRSGPAGTLALLLLALAGVTGMPLEATACCENGDEQSCVASGIVCGGARTCEGCYYGACECVYGGMTASCTVCSGAGTKTCAGDCSGWSLCTRPEVCNGCDDDRDGQTDEGLGKCAVGPFNQFQCSPTSDTTVPYTFGTGDLPEDFNAPPNYANRLRHVWTIHTNRFVQTMGLRFDAFNLNTAGIDDVLQVGSFETLTGTLTPPPPAVRSYNIAGAGPSGVIMRFESEMFDSGPGFTIGQAKVRCGASGVDVTPQLGLFSVVDGFLAGGTATGDGDTLFFSLAGAPEDIYVVVDGSDTWAPADLDLYVRSGSRPQKNVYNQRSINANSKEVLKIAGPTTGQTLFIAVTAWAPFPGSFRLITSRAKKTWIRTAGTEVVATPGQLDIFRDNLERATRRVFGATEGQAFIKQINLFNSGSCQCGGAECDICFVDGVGETCHGNTLTVSHCCWDITREWGKVRIFPGDVTNNRVIAHELLHCPVGNADAHKPHIASGVSCHDDSVCGHTMMGLLSQRTNGLCFFNDHGLDLPASGHVCASCPTDNTACPGTTCAVCKQGSTSEWVLLKNAGTVVDAPSDSPDNNTYEVFFEIEPFISVVDQ